MIPEHANWLVENMAVTELHFYGSILGSYPNVLSVMVDVISEHKPNQIHFDDKQNLDVKDQPIPTWLTIDVLDGKDINDTPALEPMDPKGKMVGKHAFELKNVELKNDRGGVDKTVVCVQIRDYLVYDGAEDDDFMKYGRALSIVFYTQP